jgi:hypothetical protein
VQFKCLIFHKYGIIFIKENDPNYTQKNNYSIN